jgi:hypothetical protein
MKSKALLNLISFLFAILLIFFGIINTFWGNDSGLGVGLLILSFLYFPPITKFIQQKIGFHIPICLKIVLAILLLWIVLGVGELFGKIGMMIEDLN